MVFIDHQTKEVNEEYNSPWPDFCVSPIKGKSIDRKCVSMLPPEGWLVRARR